MDYDYLKYKKILIVDDEADLREMVTSILAQDGFKTIRTAGTVAEALKICRDWEPDLAILDVMLPDGDGFSLFEQMRTFTEVPVLFLTARGEDEDMLNFSVLKLLIDIIKRAGGSEQCLCLFRRKLQFLHTHHNVLSHRVLVGMIQNFLRRLIKQPVSVLVLLGFHLIVEQGVVVCFAHSEHLLKQKYSRLIFCKNQAAM